MGDDIVRRRRKQQKGGGGQRRIRKRVGERVMFTQGGFLVLLIYIEQSTQCVVLDTNNACHKSGHCSHNKVVEHYYS